MTQIKCVICKKEFNIFPCRVGKIVTCSKKCAIIRRRTTPLIKNRRRIVVNCVICNKPFEISLSRKGKLTCCSPKCKSQKISSVQKLLPHPKMYGKDHPFYGKHHTEATIKKISESRKGKLIGCLHPKWKGKDVGYRSLHHWVKRRIGILKKCSKCGIENLRGKNGKNLIELANKSGKYLRDISDWLILCKPCHAKYDAERRIL